MIEVEYKYAVESVDSLQTMLEQLNAQFVETVRQEDIYFNHRHDNFKQKDIAFRVRQSSRSSGSITWLTYKGPNQDDVGKIREEHEVRLSENETAETLQKILAGVGFQAVSPVRKTRDRYRLTVEGTAVEFCLDQVEGLGAFAEIEVVVEQQVQVASAKKVIQLLANQFGLTQAIRTSYLDLLLDEE
jgi:adenylate cyclase class 2